MADRIQTFTTRIFLNDEQAKSKITELGKRITTVRADMDKAYKKKERAKKELKKIGDINKGITKSEGWSWLKKLNVVGLDDTDACCFGRLQHLSALKRQVPSVVQPAKHCFPNFCDNCHGISRRLPQNNATVGTEYRDSCHRLQRAGNWGDGNQ
ncbi:MAG: hypothetical protein SPG93_03905 [Prevotella sp.]|nr:hypothetical protein [Prevotella sp.]